MKRGAMELSVSTIVVVIIALAMLVLGLMATNKMMCAAINGIEVMNKEAMEEMINSFNPGEDLVIKELENTIAKDVPYGVGFAIRNNDAASENFEYSISVSGIGNCNMSELKAEEFIIMGKSGDVMVPSGKDYVGLVRFFIPKDTESCSLRYGITVTNNGENYDFKEFDVEIVNKKFSQNIC